MAKQDPEMTRRLALQRLGLAAGAVYMAPVVMNLSDAKASSGSSGGSASGGGGGASAGSGGAGTAGAGSSGSSMSMPSDDVVVSPTDPATNPVNAVLQVPGKVVNGIGSLFRR